MEKNTSTFHTGVLLNEVLEALNVVPGETYLDCTFGGGTHSEAILNFGGKVVGLEVDPDAIEYAERKFGLKREIDGVWVTNGGSLRLYQENFRSLDSIVRKAGLESVSGVLFDLGVSSFQLDQAERGFSFSKEASLDMRMDPRLAVLAKDLVNVLNEGELYELFKKLGEERNARSFARHIVRNRVNKRIETTTELANILVEEKGRKARVHPATRVFMALRIAVNDELGALAEALPKASEILRVGGRLAVISFHSLEDRIVKGFLSKQTSLRRLNEKPTVAQDEELRLNKRSRSAKLRVAERI